MFEFAMGLTNSYLINRRNFTKATKLNNIFHTLARLAQFSYSCGCVFNYAVVFRLKK